ncbi:carboxypeptidase-like regulatory domain-containing protein [Niabella sp. W65]|nr:carboxypeptidase-like regulatory domain-containing protein [Niabella sp. W65]MCH7362408.1 carboxypeptidase-like regulatory domain-containing protein [Niabella sp. W65]
MFLLLLLCSFCSNAQTVKGWVSSKGQPVTGASIKVKGAATSAASDSSGSFTIEAPAASVLEISHVSYLKKEVPVNGQTSINIELEPMAANLDEVVVVGYGTQKK